MRARSLCPGVMERVRDGRPLHHRVEPARALAAGRMARIRGSLLAAGSGWPDVPPAPTGHVCGGLDHCSRSPRLVSCGESALARGRGGDRYWADSSFPLSRRERGSGGEDGRTGRRADFCRPSRARRGRRQRHRPWRADGRRRCVSRGVRGRRSTRRDIKRRGARAGPAQ